MASAINPVMLTRRIRNQIPVTDISVVQIEILGFFCKMLGFSLLSFFSFNK